MKSHIGRLWSIAALIVASMALSASTASAAAPADHCSPGQNPRFVLGFANLQAAVGGQMGGAVTCEFADPNGTGDVHQQTTSGLAFWRKRSNTPTFTNGYDHWALTSGGLVHWLGSSIDPPSVAAPPPAARPATPAPAAPANTAQPSDAALRTAIVSAASDINAFWGRTLPAYKPVTLKWYRGAVQTGCGSAESDGPFYCPPDRTVYLESPFFETLWKKGWNVGLQIIVAHEIGHYVQDLSGIHPAVRPTRAGQVFSVDAEIGADCLGGIWAGDAYRRGTVSRDGLNEALDISYASGDVAGTPWNARDAHGTPAQRSDSFMLGVQHGSPAECLAL